MNEKDYLTSGQVSRRLRVSVSTVKRWLEEPEVKVDDRRNFNGWRLFTEKDVEYLRHHKKKLKKDGKRFKKTTLIPAVVARRSGQ